MKSRMAERIFSLLLIALAVSAYWQSLSLLQGGTRTGLFTGPAFFPQWLSILLIVCCAIIFGKTFLPEKQGPAPREAPPPKAERKVFTFLGMVGLAFAVTAFLGWLPAQFLLVLAIEIGLEKRKWPVAALISIVAVAVVYGVFEFGLGVRFPRGIWD